MTMRLVCDHCEGVIAEGEFREIRRSRMSRDVSDPMAGTARIEEETYHFHTLCFESRLRAAERAPLASSPPPPELPADHPLAQLEQQRVAAQEDLSRTGEHPVVNYDDPQAQRAALEEMTVDELQEEARNRKIEGRSEMKKSELIDALLNDQA